ncbi:hypothetical protein DAEQUDRAFT_729422 [Daedalea quercina L-15889]|uniref:RING-type domain-containing protein n=1 Tax=Daedalea quercina L-15889 TaxID=1314783 RepID=A0A165NNN2_9APHY|nr:hypothetical protein DAEQUDRAFT_729422 [Daedalea quercina L-15889]
MPVTRGQSARPHRHYSPVAAANLSSVEDDVIILSSDDEQPLKAQAQVPTPRRGRSKQKNRAPIPPSADIVEISSDDEEVAVARTPIARRQQDATASLQRQLKEALQEVERLRKEARAAEKQKAAAAPTDATLLADLEEIVTCEICTFKMWAPYALPCGHTFCQTCLQDWFGTAQAQHLTNYPQADRHYFAAHRNALQLGHLPPYQRQEMEMHFARHEAMFPRPKYTCPTCRTECKTRPTEVFALKAMAERVAKVQGESAPNAPARPRVGQPRLIDGPFDGFFP